MTKDKLKSIADWCIKEGTANTRTGKWEITFDELEYRYGKGFSQYSVYTKLLEQELKSRDEINELIMTEDAIEMNYHLRYCPECQKGGIAGAMSLLSVLGCNITDEHSEKVEEGTIPYDYDEREIDVMMAKHTLWLNDQGGEQADFSGGVIDDYDFSGEVIAGIIFGDCILKNCNLNCKEIVGCTFDHGVIENCDMWETYFNHCSLEGTKITDCRIQDSTFEECNMKNSSIDDSSVYGLKLDFVCVEDVSFQDLESNQLILDACYADYDEWLALCQKNANAPDLGGQS